MAVPTATPRSVKVQLDTGLRKDVGKLSLLFTGVGSIIGSGWLFGAFNASQQAGPSAIFAWVIGGIIFMLIGIVYAELGVMFPVAGGVVRFPQYSHGSFAGFSNGWITWLSAGAVVPIEVLASVGYATPYLPWLMVDKGGTAVLSGPGLAISIALMFIYSLINVMGVKAFARFNNVLVWWKLLVIVVAIVVFFAVAFHPGNLTDFGGFAPNGESALFASLPAAGIAFAYLGFRQGVEFAGETDNPQKNVPFAIIGSILITMVIYVALQIAFITALPSEQLAGGWSKLGYTNDAGPLAGLALLLGTTWLAFTLYADAIISPADTGLIYAGVTARLGYANGRNANAPAWLTRLNGRGVPWLAVVAMFVVGCIFFLPFPSWSQFVGFVTSATVISFASGGIVVAALRRQLPDQERPFKLPGGDTLPYLAFFCSNLVVYWTGWQQNEKIFASIIAGYVIFIVYHFVAPDRVPPVKFKNGSWFPLWIAGLIVISYLSIYGSAPDETWFPGGTSTIPFGWGILVVAAWSAIIYAYALAVRLSPEEAAENIQRTPKEAVRAKATGVEPEPEPGV